MTRSPTDAAHELGKTMSGGPIAKAREPGEEMLKHRGDKLQNLVDKATGGAPKAH